MRQAFALASPASDATIRGALEATREPLGALEFRPFDPVDRDAVARWLGRSGMAGARVDARSWTRLVADSRIVARVAVRGPRTVGFVRLDLAPDRAAEITVLVAPDMRRRGVGRRLVEHAVAESKQFAVRRIIAMVDPDNRRAAAFFGALGFESAASAARGFERLDRLLHNADAQPPLEIEP